jgi:rare lipoprotein A
MLDRDHFGLSTTGVFRLFLLLAAGFWLSACASTGPRYASGSSAPASVSAHHGGATAHGTMKPYEVAGRWYTPEPQPHYNEVGVASWYGYGHEGRTTANGEAFDTEVVAAAHKTLPLPCYVEVTNLTNGRKLKVRVNDRGPFVDGRIIDLTHAAAQKLGYAGDGVTKVRVRYLGPAEPESRQARAAARPAPKPDVVMAAFAGQGPTTPGAFAVQAGAFSDRERAERAAFQLGQGRVKPLTRGMTTVYRVVLGPAPDARAAEALRVHATKLGYADAKVIPADF